jgi:hypothetical protein
MRNVRLRLLGAVLASSAATYLATGAPSGPAGARAQAAAQPTAAQPAAAQPAARGGGGDGGRVVVDEKDLRTFYSNAYRIHTTAEEVVLDFGFNMTDPNPPGEARPAEGTRLLFTVSNRTIMSYPNAKRLSNSMAELVKRYEQKFGEIETEPKKPRL